MQLWGGGSTFFTPSVAHASLAPKLAGYGEIEALILVDLEGHFSSPVNAGGSVIRGLIDATEDGSIREI